MRVEFCNTSVEVNDVHDNITTRLTLESFFDNFDDIPLEAIDELVAKYEKK